MNRGLLQHLLTGESYARYCMYQSLRDMQVSGLTLDVGGGKLNRYLEQMNVAADVDIITLDMSTTKDSQGNPFDLETKPFPHQSDSFDTVLIFNLLEHIFNHQGVVNETFRVLRTDGTLIGFVPFLLNVHPDPHDYFRYTNEALEKILSQAGYEDIEVTAVGKGPAMIAYNAMHRMVPILLRPLLLVVPYVLDSILCYLRPKLTERVPIGYTFVAHKYNVRAHTYDRH